MSNPTAELTSAEHFANEADIAAEAAINAVVVAWRGWTWDASKDEAKALHVASMRAAAKAAIAAAECADKSAADAWSIYRATRPYPAEVGRASHFAQVSAHEAREIAKVASGWADSVERMDNADFLRMSLNYGKHLARLVKEKARAASDAAGCADAASSNIARA